MAQIANTISRNIGILKRIQYKVDSGTALFIYDAMLLPHLNYCNIVWASGSNTDLERLHKLQKRAVCAIFFANSLTHSASLFFKLRRFNIYDIYRSLVCHFIYSYINLLLLITFNIYFSQNGHIHHPNNRAALKIHLCYVRTGIRASSTKVHEPVLWNKFPSYVHDSSTLGIFRHTLQCYLLSYYCPDPWVWRDYFRTWCLFYVMKITF